jgi:hypothetical protein
LGNVIGAAEHEDGAHDPMRAQPEPPARAGYMNGR